MCVYNLKIHHDVLLRVHVANTSCLLFRYEVLPISFVNARKPGVVTTPFV